VYLLKVHKQPHEKMKLEQTTLLHTRLGIPGSGYTRYGAAMWLFQNEFMASDDLEAYRICCKLDNEAPNLKSID
jgi:hypothetical protein